jgi:cephalosporin-C deacetylase-like acetyl esterase
MCSTSTTRLPSALRQLSVIANYFGHFSILQIRNVIMPHVTLIRLIFSSWVVAITSHAATLTVTTPKPTPWDLAALCDAPAFHWVDAQGPVRSLFYAGEAYKEQPTRVFAYYATPGTLAGDTTADKDLPAVVLAHGGGGTAFREWVELWAKRGYAAIAMDLAGYQPIAGQNPHLHENRARLSDGGPDQEDDDKFGSVDQPAREQWPYHAVATVIRAHSLIRSFPEVDSNRTAVTGISWGGYLTCIVAGVDSRFKAAVPVYGGGFLHENSAWLNWFARMTETQRDRWISLWDPSQYLPDVSIPILFVNGTNDFAYPLDSYMRSYDAVPANKQLRIMVDLPHSHPAGWKPVEIGLFVDHYLKGGQPLPRLGTTAVADQEIHATWDSALPVATAELHQTTDHGPINQRKWTSTPASIAEREMTAAAPNDDVTAWFLTLTDTRGAGVSSRVFISK